MVVSFFKSSHCGDDNKNFLRDELDIKKRRDYVKKNRPQNMGESTLSTRTPARQEEGFAMMGLYR
jgi:hypothetical protein